MCLIRPVVARALAVVLDVVFGAEQQLGHYRSTTPPHECVCGDPDCDELRSSPAAISYVST